MKQNAILALLACLFPTVTCLGNLSGPWKPGQLLLDVEGVKDVAIVRETLRIDLRPLERGGNVKISATYVVEHVQPARELPLTFVTGADSIRSVECRLNGVPLAFTTKQVVNMPDTWKPPETTPGFVPEEQLLYSRSITDTQHEWILFTVPLRTGRQTIEVSYEVEAGAYYSPDHTAKYWQTAYILSPAKTWKSFGGLTLEVMAPANWPVKSNLPLVNEGERWTGRFDSLPADFLTLTTQHPDGRRVAAMGLAGSAVFFAFCTILLGLKHGLERFRLVKQSGGLDPVPKCTHNHLLWLLLLLAFLPLVWNGVSIYGLSSSLPSTQANYQLPVIYLYFQGMHWLVALAVLLLCSKVVLVMFCSIGAWAGRGARDGAVPNQ
jgi:hypothetical protein